MSIIDSLFSIVSSFLTSGTFFVTIPFSIILTGFLLGLIRRLMVGKF